MAFTATTVNSAAAWRPDLYTFEPINAVPEAAILLHTNVSGTIEGDQPVLRVAYVSDDDAKFYDEGQTFDEAEPELQEALVYTRKFGQLVKLSREQYRQTGTADELARSVARAMTAKADNALLAQAAPVGPATAPVPGLTNWPGIVDAGEIGFDLDELIDLEAEVRANGADPTAWILAPTTWAYLRKLKTTETAATNLLGAGTDNSEPRLLSVPVALNSQMPAYSGLLIDRTQVISAVSALEIATDASRYFDSDSVAVRATWRTGHTVPRPNRIGTFTVAAEGS